MGKVRPNTDTAQPALPGTATPRWRGPVERSIAKSIRGAREREDLTGADEAALALLRSAARLVDWCEKNHEPHTQTLAIKQMSELLSKLHMVPDARSQGGGVADAWDQAAADLGTAEGGHPEV